MPWVRFDDNYPDHPKVSELSDAAFRLHVSAICYSSRYLTDGFVSRGQLRRIATTDDLAGVLDELVAAGLFEPADGGFWIHDYLDYNPSRDAVESRRASDRQRKRTPNGFHAESTPPVPHPVPLPDSPDPASPDPGPNARARVGAHAREGEAGDDDAADPLLVAVCEGVYGKPPPTLLPSERERAEAAADELWAHGVPPGAVRERCAAWRTHWPTMTISPRGLVSNWSRLGELMTTNGPPDAAHQQRSAAIAERRAQLFAAAGLVGDADDGGAGRSRAAARPDGVSGVPEPPAAARGLRDVRRDRDGVPGLPGGALDRAPSARGPDPDGLPAV